jgi:hypothetical protein
LADAHSIADQLRRSKVLLRGACSNRLTVVEIGDPGNGLEVTSGVDGGEALIISPLDPGDDRNSVRHVVADTQEPLRQVPGVYRVALESLLGV